MSLKFQRFARTSALAASLMGASLMTLAACSPSTQPAETAQTAAPSATSQDAAQAAPEALRPASTGYAESSEGLKVYYEVYGQGEPIVVMAGGLMDISTMAQTIGPLSRERQVIGIDLEGHGRTALRETPMSHQKLGDDIAAVLKHLNIAKADVAGYSHGGDAAIRMAIQHPDMVRNLIVISTAAERDGWYPEVLKGMEGVGSAQAEAMKQTPLYTRYAEVSPNPEKFPVLLDRMGELMKKDYDWREEIKALQTPALLIFADHDAISMNHIAEFFGLFGGGVKDAGWDDTPEYSRARLAIVPGYTHYNFGMGPDIARVIEAYLDQGTSRPARAFAACHRTGIRLSAFVMPRSRSCLRAA
jgi:pimeloyl-ACP methyl ester carboxylesterase